MTKDFNSNKVTTHVMIRSKDCLSCKHLCSLNTKEYDCYNAKLCPAHYFNIIEGLDLVKVSQRLGRAIKDNDSKKIARLTSIIAEYDEVISNEVMERAKVFSKS